MNILQKMRMSIRKRAGNVILRSDVAALGSASQVTDSIKTLMQEGALVRLGEGIYAKASKDVVGRVSLVADEMAIAREVFKKLDIPIIQMWDEWKQGRRVLWVDMGHHRISRRLDIGGVDVYFLKAGFDPPSRVFLPDDPDRLPRVGVSGFVERLAKAHHLVYRRTGVDDWSEAVTRAAGDDVRLDRTGKLLVALKKRQVISGKQMARLITSHLRERAGARIGVRSVSGF